MAVTDPIADMLTRIRQRRDGAARFCPYTILKDEAVNYENPQAGGFYC